MCVKKQVFLTIMIKRAFSERPFPLKRGWRVDRGMQEGEGSKRFTVTVQGPKQDAIADYMQ